METTEYENTLEKINHRGKEVSEECLSVKARLGTPNVILLSRVWVKANAVESLMLLCIPHCNVNIYLYVCVVQP